MEVHVEIQVDGASGKDTLKGDYTSLEVAHDRVQDFFTGLRLVEEQNTSMYGETPYVLAFTEQKDAQEVLSRLKNIIDKYRRATISDVLETIGEPMTYLDNRWGWYELGETRVTPARSIGIDGDLEVYILSLPKPIAL